MEISDLELRLIKSQPFATLISAQDNQVVHISKAPLLLKTDGELYHLEGHLAKNNPHIEYLMENPELSLIFDGSHGYISPTWYKDVPRNVPTWNYSSLSIQGNAEIIDSQKWLLKSVLELTDNFEENDVWKNSADHNYLKNLSKGIIGIKILVHSIKSKFKLSQNRNDEDHKRIVSSLNDINPGLSIDMSEHKNN